MFFGKKKLRNDFNDLIGTWQIDSSDINARMEYGEIKMIFDNRGNPPYEIKENDRLQIVKLTYVVENSFLITNQEKCPWKGKNRIFFQWRKTCFDIRRSKINL